MKESPVSVLLWMQNGASDGKHSYNAKTGVGIVVRIGMLAPERNTVVDICRAPAGALQISGGRKPVKHECYKNWEGAL